jgi:hypothetical protein
MYEIGGGLVPGCHGDRKCAARPPVCYDRRDTGADVSTKASHRITAWQLGTGEDVIRTFRETKTNR